MWYLKVYHSVPKCSEIFLLYLCWLLVWVYCGHITHSVWFQLFWICFDLSYKSKLRIWSILNYLHVLWTLERCHSQCFTPIVYSFHNIIYRGQNKNLKNLLHKYLWEALTSILSRWPEGIPYARNINSEKIYKEEQRHESTLLYKWVLY